MSDTPAVMDIKEDILDMIKKSEEITYEKWRHRPIWQKIVQWVLKLFSPLL